MTIRKRSVTLGDTNAHSLGLSSQGGHIKRVDMLSSADTSVSLAITDATSQTIFSAVSGNYTTRFSQNIDKVAVSPVTITATGLGSGTFTVDIWEEV